jgi:hypothetical protein
VLGASTVGGTLTVTDSVGNLTQTGVLTVAGTSSFTTSTSGATITLTSANLLTGAASLNTNGAAANASLTNAKAGGLILGASNVGGSLTVQTDSISVTGAINASGQTVTLAPRTAATTMGVGTGAGTLSLSQASLDNITASTLVFGSAGSTGAMTVDGTVTLPSSITNLSLVTGNSITVASSGSLSNPNASGSLLLQAPSLTLNGPVSVNGSNGVLTLSTTGTATQSAAITATNLALLGSGGSYTLNHAGNLIGTLAVNTGSVSLTNGQALTIGTVSGTTGWTTTGNSALTAIGATADITVSNAVTWANSTLTLSAGRAIAINAGMNGGAAGDLTAIANGSVTIGAPGSVTGKTIALAATGAFINFRGSDAVSATDRWLIYSSAPDASGQNFGNLNSNNTAIWNSTYATLPPPLVPVPGNRYIFAFAAGTTPATLTVTSLDAAKIYGSTAALSQYTVTGFQAGIPNVYLADPNVVSGTPAFASAGAIATANAGIYGINISQGTLSANGNYAFAFNSTGLLTVNPAALTITANNATQTYNNVPYSGGNGVIYSGFVNGQTASVLSGTIAYGGSSQGAVNAGTYTIIPSNQTSANYAINYVDGTLMINPAAITVTANNQIRFIGEPDPTLTYQVTSGTLFGSSSLSGALTRAPGNNVGAYAITQGTLGSPNYNITFVGATLFIEVNSATTLISSPSLVVTTTNNNFPTLSASSAAAAPPLSPSTAGGGVDVNQPRVRVVRSSDGTRIILESVANPPR